MIVYARAGSATVQTPTSTHLSNYQTTVTFPHVHHVPRLARQPYVHLNPLTKRPLKKNQVPTMCWNSKRRSKYVVRNTCDPPIAHRVFSVRPRAHLYAATTGKALPR